ncbi:phenazine biosynthesis-like domain-containing protein isoform X1 [Xyrichtys novacula]|uniref:Phenazine biosynthesis-like domain-containing protein isoform X1 n=1 Tax=Xyrichtys novacula TaxID=13765 RepID=A0AAV1EJH7_XYRNO|nr:phenazine biosynthesis-like domain-containing protein isoform X1 [Xyrichtys novacula]
MEIPVYTVDAFTNLPFKGNPAAICPLMHELSDDLYQKIAAEMNLAETAFVTRLNPSDNFTTGSRFRLRWFTPTNEVNLCGHATLATAAVLFLYEKNENSCLELFEDANEFRDIIKVILCCGDVCFSRSVLTSLKVDPAALMSSEKSGRVKGLILTMKGHWSKNNIPLVKCYCLISVFAGSAHTVLGSYWSEKLGKKKMLAFQCSKRGGELELEVRDDGRINICGNAVFVLQGTIKL